MRIRSLKPEFWSHPVMCQQSAELRLLAIGLLNLADDEGFFVAHPAIIRGSLMPFEESTRKIPKLLDRLVAIGYITITQQPDGIEIGHVTNFLKHQRINRPSKSRLKGGVSEDSVNTHGVVTDDSRGEQGTGNREEEQGREQGGERTASAVPPHPDQVMASATGTPEKKERGRAAPANVEEALAYAETYSRGNAEMLIIEDAWVRDWHDERESVGWMKVSAGTQVPITDWKADLLRWSRRETRYPRPEAAKKDGATQRGRDVPELPEGCERALAAMFGDDWEERGITFLNLTHGDQMKIKKWCEDFKA